MHVKIGILVGIRMYASTHTHTGQDKKEHTNQDIYIVIYIYMLWVPCIEVVPHKKSQTPSTEPLILDSLA